MLLTLILEGITCDENLLSCVCQDNHNIGKQLMPQLVHLI